MSRFTGTTTIVRLVLRRDRVRLPVWLASLTGLMGVSAAAVQGLYDTPAERLAYERTTGSSGAAIALSGPPTALDTLGGITVFEVSQVSIIGISLMTIFLTLRHTRADEEAGRTELLRAGVLGRNADVAAIGLVMAAASALTGAGLAATMIGVGLPVGGSVLFGTATATLGLIFTTIALVAAQVAEHNRGAVGLSLTMLGVLYGLRAVGDVNDSFVTWLSPIGWVQGVHAFGENRWWPLTLALCFCAATTAFAGWLTTRRDIGSGLIASRPGSPEGSRWLGSPLGLAARMQRGALIGWAVGIGALGAVYGSFGRDVQNMVEENPELKKYFEQAAGDVTITDAYFGIVLLFTALVATGFTVSSVLRLRTEEAETRAEQLLATPVSRWHWTLSWLAVTVTGTVAVLGVGGAAAGTAWALLSSDPSQVISLTLAQLTYVPAALVLGGVAFALFGWLPRAAGFAWAGVVACFVIGWMGDLLSLPDWLADFSPFEQTPLVPSVELDALPLLAIAAVAALLIAAGATGFRRRDLVME
ncbi:MAG TPA: polyketide antibiotic transporter [Nocardioidaceae bacterium]|nr:polyketide antibiotic transporter [Nocardioidaceae bacterium]